MNWLGGLILFVSGALFGVVLSGILAASGKDSEMEYYYNLGKEAAKKEMQNGKE